MCGRYALSSDFPSLERALKLLLSEGEQPSRDNVTPGT